MISLASARIAPKPRPGKMNALLPWPIAWSLSPTRTGGNGLPVATIARPWLHASRSSGVASHALVGFDSGKTTGRSTLAHIARTIGSVNVCGCPDRPSSTVAFPFSIVWARSKLPVAPARQPRAGLRVVALVVLHRAPFDEQPLRVEDEDARPRLFEREALAHHPLLDCPGHARRRRRPRRTPRPPRRAAFDRAASTPPPGPRAPRRPFPGCRR